MSASPYFLSNSTVTVGAAPPNTATVEARASAETLVFRVDIVIIILFGFYGICRSPRALARIFHGKEWSSGHILRHVSQRRPTPVVHSSIEIDPPTKDSASDVSHTLYSHFQAQFTKEKGGEMPFPPHVASCVRWLRPFVAPLSSRISPGFSISQWLVLGIYFIILLFPSFFRSSPFTDPNRTGYVAMCQIPFVFALTAKNGAVGTVIGLGYEKVRWYQQFIPAIESGLNLDLYLYS